MTERELKICCKYWQHLLRLDDIDITVRFAAKMEMDALGRTSMSADRTSAMIRVCSDSLVAKDVYYSTDEELTLVHELLHIQQRCLEVCDEFKDLLKKNSMAYQANEQAIERNSQALLQLKRQINRKVTK